MPAETKAKRSAAAKRAHETRREGDRLDHCRMLAREAFLDAAHHLGPAYLGNDRDPAQALALGAIGVMRLAQSDPAHRLKERAEAMLREAD